MLCLVNCKWMLWNAWYFVTSFYHWLLDCCKYHNCLITWFFDYCLGLPVMYCLLEVVSVYPEKLATRFVDKMDWIKVCWKPFFWFIFLSGEGFALAKSGIFPWCNGVLFPGMRLIWNVVFLLTVNTSWGVICSRVGKIIFWSFGVTDFVHWPTCSGSLGLCHWLCWYSQSVFPLD